MKATGSSRRWLAAVAASLAVAGYASTARADIVIGEKDGWNANFNGFLNLFLVDTFGQAAPTAPHAPDVWSAPTDNNVFRVRTGFLPAAFGFNANAPEWQGIKTALRVGLYVQLNNINTRTTPTGNYENTPLIDWREFNITMSGKFGEVLVGRTLNLYQSDSILGDISLFGVGIPGQIAGNVLGGWPTLGHIGFGYLYSAFGAQFRYTTPDLSGFKLAVAVGDPSKITGGASANITSIPLFEATASYANKWDNVSFKVWLGGIFNRAWFSTAEGPTVTGTASGAVNGRGGSAGLDVGVSGFDLQASGFWASGIGTFQQFDGGDSLDSSGAPVTSAGYLLQATYQLDKTKLGVNYGQVMADRTPLQQTANAPVIKNRQSITAGVYHDLNKFVKLVGEYSWYQLNWYGTAVTSGASQSGNVLTGGLFFFW